MEFSGRNFRERVHFKREELSKEGFPVRGGNVSWGR